MPKSFVVLADDGKREEFLGEFRSEVEAQIHMTRRFMQSLDTIMHLGAERLEARQALSHAEIRHVDGQMNLRVLATY